jgi:hypothetical protein
MSRVMSGRDGIAAAPQDPALGRDLVAGAIAGQIAGLVMAVVVMAVFTIFLGRGPLYPVQVIGSLVFGDAALQGIHVGALAAGLLLHQLGPSLAWGLVFGLVMHRYAPRGAGLVAAALAVGVASQVIDVLVLVPVVMRALHGHDIWAEQVPAFWSWAAHVVFGLGLLSYPRVAARLAR